MADHPGNQLRSLNRPLACDQLLVLESDYFSKGLN